MLLEGHEDTYAVTQGCWLRWLGTLRDAGPWLPAGSHLSGQTAASPSLSIPHWWCRHRCQRLLPYGADVYTAPAYAQRGRSICTGGCPALGGPSTPKPSAPF